MFSRHDHECMSQALALARRGLYTASPNPRVGCVISRDGEIIGSGWHRRAGTPHAEIHAINSVSGSLKGATAYVTLEPCSHHGRTPPCCEALVREQISRVVIAMRDPNPQVAGRGIAYLEKHNVQVDIGLNEQQALELNPGFISRMTRQRPWVRVKLAASLDGRTALRNGKSQWITGPAAREDVQRWRARSDCIMTGSGTVLADNPSMNVRLEGLRSDFTQPLRAIIDSALATPVDAKILAQDGSVIIFSKEKINKYNKLENISIVKYDENAKGKIDLHEVLRHLAQLEINEVHVEAGAGLCGALLQQDLIDELLIYQAGVVMGSAARGMFDVPTLTEMDQATAFTLEDTRRIGSDIRSIFRASS